MRPIILTIFLTIFGFTAIAQTQVDIDSLLVSLNGQSENITKDTSVIKLINKGETMLTTLSNQFIDTTPSKVFSKCAGRFLTRGEIAIIIADHIEGMPYFTLTGLQNCTLELCKENPNVVEYYLDFIKVRGMAKTFQKRYEEWLKSSGRKKYRRKITN